MLSEVSGSSKWRINSLYPVASDSWSVTSRSPQCWQSRSYLRYTDVRIVSFTALARQFPQCHLSRHNENLRLQFGRVWYHVYYLPPNWRRCPEYSQRRGPRLLCTRSSMHWQQPTSEIQHGAKVVTTARLDRSRSTSKTRPTEVFDVLKQGHDYR